MERMKVDRFLYILVKIKRRKFEPSKIELKTISGEAKNFDHFGANLRKYMKIFPLQHVEPKSRAKELVSSYPATAEII